jgi:hypothetical protein
MARTTLEIHEAPARKPVKLTGRFPLMVRSRALILVRGELVEVEIMVAPSQRFVRVAGLIGGAEWRTLAFGPFTLGVRCQGD